MNADNLGGTVYKERLLQARLLRGVTRQELAKQLNVSRQAISQYENGACKPSPEILRQYQMLLRMPYNFFLKPPLPSASTALNYRRLKRSTEKEKGIAQTRIEFMAEVFHYMKNYIQFPAVSLPFKNDEEIYTPGQIETIARNVREELHLGARPIEHMMLVVENSGCIVSRYDNSDIEVADRDVDGCSRIYPLEDEARPFITLMERGSSSACRERFSLAHELGHLVLHSWADEEYVKDKANYDRMEKEANSFASAFLLPMETFARELMANYGFGSLLALKLRWKTSIAAMLYRAREIGVIGEYQCKYMFQRLNREGMKRVEPLDKEIPHEETNILRTAADLLFENEIVSPYEMVEALALPRRDINKILGYGKDSPMFSEGEIINIFPLPSSGV